MVYEICYSSNPASNSNNKIIVDRTEYTYDNYFSGQFRCPETGTTNNGSKTYLTFPETINKIVYIRLSTVAIDNSSFIIGELERTSINLTSSYVIIGYIYYSNTTYGLTFGASNSKLYVEYYYSNESGRTNYEIYYNTI